MVRYNLATALLALLTTKHQTIGAHADGDHSDPDHTHHTEAWSYLPVTIPAPLSDMAVSVITINTDSGNVTENTFVGNDDNKKTRIIITGGCNSENGNEYVEEDWGEGFSCFSLSNKAYAFDPIRNNKFQAWNGEFETLADMPRTRNRHASVVIQNQICLFGGRNETDTLIPEVDCYNPELDEWSTPYSLPEERQSSDFAAFSQDDKVYLIGGYDPYYTALDQVTVIDMSDFDNVKYSDGTKLASARGDIDVALLDGNVYVSGGFTHENYWAAPKNSVEKYSVDTQQWSEIDSLNQERGDKQLVGLHGKVYAIGGETKIDTTGPVEELPELGARSEVLDSVEVLDPHEDVHAGLAEWRVLAGMPSQLFRFAASEWDVKDEESGYIFVFGGQVEYDSDCKCFRTTDKVMVFDVDHAEKDEVNPEPTGSSGGMNVSSRVVGSFVALALTWFVF